MRSIISLSSLFRCQLCHNIFRSQSTMTDNLPFLKVVTPSTIVGRPFLKDKDIYVQHPIYSGLNVLVKSRLDQFDPFSLIEVEVAPLGIWLIKGSDGKTMTTVRDYVTKNRRDTRLQALDLNKVYLHNLKDHSDFFNSVIAVGKVQRKLSSLRSDNVWYFGSLKRDKNGALKSQCPSFSPDDMLEPEKRLENLPLNDIPQNSDVKCFYNVSQKTFALSKNLPPEKFRNNMRNELLKRYNVITHPYDSFNVKSVRHPTNTELMKRRDFRSECVFSIDPPTARDLDDALHVKRLGDRRVEVGIHIADVSYFVPSKSRLCYTAMLRGNSFYLGDEVIPMLPSALSDNLCSLHPGSDKLTLSVVLEMDLNGNVQSSWIGESIISSTAKINYTQANDIIDLKTFPDDLQLHGNHSKYKVMESIEILQRLSVKLRSRRTSAGALTFSMAKTEPCCLEGSDAPLAFAVKQYSKSSVLIEEFMLLANMTVAEFLQTKLPNQAVLRRHPEADEIDLLGLTGGKSGKSSKMPATEIKKLHQSLLEKYARLKSKTVAASLDQVLSYFAIRSMYPAEYVITNTAEAMSNYFHFGLQVPLYTHFTSPIRRFADLVVHYQVKALLHTTTPPDRVFLLRSIAISNQKRTASRRLSREMLQFHVWNALMATGSVFSKIVVVSVNRRRIRYYCPTFELVGDLNLCDDKSVISKNVLDWNHMQLTVLGCTRCKKKLVLEVKPLTELYCYLSPKKKMEIHATLAHTITCPDCVAGGPRPVRRSLYDLENVNHEGAMNAPPRPKPGHQEKNHA